MDYGKAVRIARAARGWSQTELARRAELAPSYISRIEQGSRLPSRDALDALARALNVPVLLLDLLAAPPHQLRGISESDAATLGGLLLDLVVNEEAA